MNNLAVTQRRQKLDSLFAKIKAMNFDAELEAHWARYLCILVSGFLESAVREIYGEYANRKASVTARYVMIQLKGFQNPKMQRIYELSGAFNDDWRKELENDTFGRLRESIDSIVANRNNIAHGRDVGLTIISLQDYYKDAIKVLDMIDHKCHL